MTPLQPKVLIITSKPGIGLGIRELVDRRELLYFLVWRDLKLRYKQTFFGAAWAVIQPVLLMGVFSLSIGRIPGVGAEGISYPLFVLAGLIPWTLFSQSLTGASNSLVYAESIITKVYFPRLLLPIASVMSFVLDFAISLGVLAVVMIVLGVAPTPALLLLPLLTLDVLACAAGVGIFMAALNVRYRDVKYVVPFLIQLLMFLSPVVYSNNIVPSDLRGLYALNPLAGAIEGFRWAVTGGPRPDALILTSGAAALVVLVVALLYFRRVEHTFADVI